MDLTVLRKDADKARDAIPSTAIFNGQTIKVRRMIADISDNTITTAGTLETTVAKIFVPASCAVALKRGDAITLDGEALKVGAVTTRPTDGALEVSLTGFEE